jgi:hypothetical protein
VVGHSNSLDINAEELTFSRTAAGHIASRPFMSSVSVLQMVIDAGSPRPDPQGAADTYRWDVRGVNNNSLGTRELVVNVKTKTVYHFNFVSDRQ